MGKMCEPLGLMTLGLWDLYYIAIQEYYFIYLPYRVAKVEKAPRILVVANWSSFVETLSHELTYLAT